MCKFVKNNQNVKICRSVKLAYVSVIDDYEDYDYRWLLWLLKLALNFSRVFEERQKLAYVSVIDGESYAPRYGQKTEEQ